MGGLGSGRKPTKTVAEHVAEGTYRRTRHGPKPDAPPIVPIPTDRTPPDGMNLYGAREWSRLWPLVTKAGLITEAERQLFTGYCRYFGLWVEACAKADACEHFERDKDGNETSRLNKWHRLAADAWDKVTEAAKLLGLTAVDRGKVRIARREDPPAVAKPASGTGGRGSLSILAGPFSLNDEGE